MAVALVAELVADALLDILDRCGEAIGERAEQGLEWLKQQAEPPDGLELRAPDGSVYTGLAIIERNDVILMWAFRQPATVQRPPSTAHPQHPVGLQPSYLDPDSPYWDRERPYGR